MWSLARVSMRVQFIEPYSEKLLGVWDLFVTTNQKLLSMSDLWVDSWIIQDNHILELPRESWYI